METIFRYGQHALQYHESLQLLHLNWVGKVDEDHYGLVMREVIRVTKELPVQKWLINLNNAEFQETSDRAWLTDFMAKELKDTSLSRVARVDSRSGQYERQVRQLVAEAHARQPFSLQIQFFNTEHEALAWLSDATVADFS